MKKQTLLIIGLIGGILAAVGVFLPWASATEFGITISMSGWDGRASNYPYVILLGGILALLGGLLALLAVKVKNIDYLILIGGIVALLGWIWAVADAGLSGWTYGFYTCLVGAVLALIGGIMGVMAKK
jgi:hypothetical protein